VHRNFTVALACLFMAALVPSAALAGEGAVKQALAANTRGDCAIGGFGPFPVGFVILNRADDRVSAVIALRGAPPNGRWEVELDQTPLQGCFEDPDGVVTTNSKGNGTIVVSDDFAPGNTGAFVRLNPLNDAAQSGGIIASPGAELS
jgi:hypothetical protein